MGPFQNICGAFSERHTRIDIEHGLVPVLVPYRCPVWCQLCRFVVCSVEKATCSLSTEYAAVRHTRKQVSLVATNTNTPISCEQGY